MTGFPILSLMLLIPLLGALACLWADAPAARKIALVATLIDFALGLLLWSNYEIGGAPPPVAGLAATAASGRAAGPASAGVATAGRAHC